MKRYLPFVAALGICVFASNSYAQRIKSETGCVAVGGSVTSSTIIIGIPQEKVDELVREGKRPLEELTAQQRENIALLKEKLDLNERHAALGILGENDLPASAIAARTIVRMIASSPKEAAGRTETGTQSLLPNPFLKL